MSFGMVSLIKIIYVIFKNTLAKNQINQEPTDIP